MLKNIIEIIDLNYQNTFNSFCLGIAENKFISICGPNNCGKTILLRIIDRQIEIKNTITINNIKIEDYKIYQDLKPQLKKQLVLLYLMDQLQMFQKYS